MKRRSAFTLVEVMVSLGVMTVGAMAILAMEQQTTRGNVHAREMTVATQIAQTWIERIKIDALRWANTSGTPAVDLANTSYLSAINAVNGQGVFMGIPQQPGVANLPAGTDNSNAFDYYGNELNTQASMAGVQFCAGYRLTWIYIDRLMRVDVRVWWPREGQGVNIGVDFPRCADNPLILFPNGVPSPNYHVVYLSTSVRNLQYQ